MEERNRITGTEMEWGGMVSGSNEFGKLIQVDHGDLLPSVKQYLYEQNITKMGRVGNYFLGNGARFYQDIRDRREYATPEDDSFLGTTANEIVNDGIMAGIADVYQKRTHHAISFTKRVIDDSYQGCGYHVSFCAEKAKIQISEKDLALFGLFASTRSVVFGSGALLPDGRFSMAQKVLSLNSDFAWDTVYDKPVVNLRDEPLADQKRFVRIHDTSGDPTMSPWATQTKLGAASLVLKMIEQGIRLKPIRFEDPLHHIASSVALDPSLTKRFRMTDGRGRSAMDVQKLLTIVLDETISKKIIHATLEEEQALEEWKKALADLEQNPRLTIDRIDWTMRREILRRQHERHGWGWDSDQLRYKDRQFSEVAIDGIALALRETIWAKHMPPEHMIKARIHIAPETTRAHVRGSFVRNIRRHRDHIESSVNWPEAGFNGTTYTLPDPYNPRHPEIEALLKAS